MKTKSHQNKHTDAYGRLIHEKEERRNRVIANDDQWIWRKHSLLRVLTRQNVRWHCQSLEYVTVALPKQPYEQKARYRNVWLSTSKTTKVPVENSGHQTKARPLWLECSKKSNALVIYCYLASEVIRLGNTNYMPKLRQRSSYAQNKCRKADICK